MLQSKISHLEHEKEHCEQVVGRARRKYNSIVEVRTQALQHKQQLREVFRANYIAKEYDQKK